MANTDLAQQMAGANTGVYQSPPSGGYSPAQTSYQMQYGDMNQGRAVDIFNRIGSYQTPEMQAAQMTPAEQEQWRQQQMALIAQLQGQAAGQIPGQAQQQLQQGQQAAINAAASMATTARGVSPAMARRIAAQGAADATMGTAQQSGIAQAQDMARAEAALAGALQGMRGQDVAWAGQQAEFDQQAALANQQAEFANRQMQDQGQLAALAQSFGMDQQQMQNLIEQERLRGWMHDQQAATNLTNATSDSAYIQGLVGGGMNTAGQIGSIWASRGNKNDDGSYYEEAL